MSVYHDVTVLGAGWAGIVSTKYMLEEGLTVVALERRDNLGGLWYFSDDPAEKTVMKSTRTTSSSTFTEFSDYPMPNEMGEFPHHKRMLEYLHSYSNHFNLCGCIHFNTIVERVEKTNNLWKISTSTGKVYTSKYLVVATGAPKPREDLRQSIFQGFSGSIYHSKEIKEPIEKHHNCRLLIVGGGETSADVCSDWYNHTSVIYWCAPSGGQHFFRRVGKLLPWNYPQILDKASSRFIRLVCPFERNKPGLRWMCKWTTNGSFLAYQGHGIPEWKNDTPLMRKVINKNGHVLDLIDYKKIIPKGAIHSCNGKKVTFKDGSSQEFDVIILCTGYLPSFSFLPEACKPISPRDLYKHVFNNDDPTLSFIGFIRPVVGSITAIIEVQARLAAKVYNKTIVLECKERRVNETKAEATYWNEYFKTASQWTSDNAVEGMFYTDDIAKTGQFYPNLTSLMNQNIYHWYVAMISPFNCAQYRLNEAKERTQAIETLEKHRKRTINFIHLSFLLVLRLILFDWFLTKLEYVKYRIQISPRWPAIRDTTPVRVINWIWCIPKKYFFDNKSKF